MGRHLASRWGGGGRRRVEQARRARCLRTEFVPQHDLFKRPTPEGIEIAPGAAGGASWSPAAYDPRTGLAYVAAVRARGRIRWQVKTEDPLVGGVLTTAGDLVFTGEGSGLLSAFHALFGFKQGEAFVVFALPQ